MKTSGALVFLIILNAAFILYLLGFNAPASGSDLRTRDRIDAESLSRSSFPELEKIESNQKGFSALEDMFEEIAEDKGAEYAFKVLRLANLPPGTDLHLLGHVVGDVLFKQEGLDGIHVCTQDFRNACSHSIVVGLFYEEGEGALESISGACRDAPGGRGAYTMCFHGLGHGVLAYASYDLEKAVELCEKTGTAEYNRREFSECIGGTIMEIIGGVHDREAWERQYKKYFKEDDPLYPCSADFMPDEVKPMCYNYLTPHLFQAAGGSLSNPSPVFQESISYCDAIPKEREAEVANCYGGFGKEFIVLAKERDIREVDVMTDEQIKKVYDWCSLTSNRGGTNYCLMYAMSSMYWGGENSYDSALSLCRIIDDQEYKDNCYNALTANIIYYRGGEVGYLQNFCEKLPEDYADACLARLN